MNFALTIKKIRKTTGYDQKTFGKMFGLSQQTISDLENGKKKPSKTLLAFLEYRYGDISTGQMKNTSFGSKEKEDSLDTLFLDRLRAERIINNLAVIEQSDKEAYAKVEGYIEANVSMVQRAEQKKTA